ncbi:hypothetical protein EVAR_68636_1 [Eumeta japonica]|uniref:Uncharacterized protein n=1 Tax=Eumeta variegata TaxID=151549 RepID=A0A4C1ZNS9_EUMVA|nr:hypothetical protein EVAR_68636_1 [Eumeta japonica]
MLYKNAAKQGKLSAILDKDKIENALKLLKKKKFTLDGASQHLQIPKTTLRRYYNYAMKEGKEGKNLTVKRVFDDEQDRMLMSYIKEEVILQLSLTLKG